MDKIDLQKPLSTVSEYAGNIRDAQGLGGRNKKTQKMHASGHQKNKP